MTTVEMIARIGDLEQALALVSGFMIVAIVLLANIGHCDCTPRHTCASDSSDPRCPMCFKKHDPKERCA